MKIKIPVCVEHFNGETYMGFIIEVDTETKEYTVGNTIDCSHADTDGDYLFDSDDNLIRIQSDINLDEDVVEEVNRCFDEITNVEIKARR